MLLRTSSGKFVDAAELAARRVRAEAIMAAPSKRSRPAISKQLPPGPGISLVEPAYQGWAAAKLELEAIVRWLDIEARTPGTATAQQQAIRNRCVQRQQLHEQQRRTSWR